MMNWFSRLFGKTEQAAPGDVQPEKINEKDGSVLVWIPPGEFEMGDGQDSDCPKHQVYLDGYYLGRHCITNKQYQRFIEATGHRPPDKSHQAGDTPIWQGRSYPAAYAEHPVVCVRWADAYAYCAWAGLALPTEAQWERGARGPKNLLFPWGNAWKANKCRNYYNRRSETTCPVFAYPKGVSGFGTLNQSGNVWEWCQDWYGKDYYRNSPSRNPEGPSTGSYRVLRGGTWHFSMVERFRAVDRCCGDPRMNDTLIGFRPCLPPGLCLSGKTEQAAPGNARPEKLTCAGCGTEYLLGTSGQMVTTRVAMAKMAADGMVIMGSGPPAKLQDTLYSAGPSDWNQASRQMHDQSMTEIRESLAGGQHRTWMCRSCGHDQDYPPNL